MIGLGRGSGRLKNMGGGGEKALFSVSLCVPEPLLSSSQTHGRKRTGTQARLAWRRRASCLFSLALAGLDLLLQAAVPAGRREVSLSLYSRKNRATGLAGRLGRLQHGAGRHGREKAACTAS